MLIEQEVSGDIEELTALFKQSPEKAEQAIQRTLSKLSRWAERQVLRDMSRRIKVSQKRLKELNRIKVRLNKSYGRKERYLTIWIGINEVGAHRLGNPRQTRRGVRVGSHSFWENSFLMQPVNASRELIFERKDNWQHVTNSPNAQAGGCGWACHWKRKPSGSIGKLKPHWKKSALYW